MSIFTKIIERASYEYRRTVFYLGYWGNAFAGVVRGAAAAVGRCFAGLTVRFSAAAREEQERNARLLGIVEGAEATLLAARGKGSVLEEDQRGAFEGLQHLSGLLHDRPKGLSQLLARIFYPKAFAERTELIARLDAVLAVVYPEWAESAEPQLSMQAASQTAQSAQSTSKPAPAAWRLPIKTPSETPFKMPSQLLSGRRLSETAAWRMLADAGFWRALGDTAVWRKLTAPLSLRASAPRPTSDALVLFSGVAVLLAASLVALAFENQSKQIAPDDELWAGDTTVATAETSADLARRSPRLARRAPMTDDAHWPGGETGNGEAPRSDGLAAKIREHLSSEPGLAASWTQAPVAAAPVSEPSISVPAFEDPTADASNGAGRAPEVTMAATLQHADEPERLSSFTDLESAATNPELASAVALIYRVEKEVELLLEHAEDQLAAWALTTPVDDNAFKTFQLVLQLQPDNPDAIAGIERIGLKYVALANSSVAKGKLRQARHYAKKAKQFAPNHPSVRALAIPEDQPEPPAESESVNAPVENEDADAQQSAADPEPATDETDADTVEAEPTADSVAAPPAETESETTEVAATPVEDRQDWVGAPTDLAAQFRKTPEEEPSAAEDLEPAITGPLPLAAPANSRDFLSPGIDEN